MVYLVVILVCGGIWSVGLMGVEGRRTYGSGARRYEEDGLFEV